jgi:hypothetical protein
MGLLLKRTGYALELQTENQALRTRNSHCGYNELF